MHPDAIRRIPPIHCLAAFESLARLRSVTRAADELSVTPSAVSHRLRQLETQLGVKLFARSDFSLTPEGAFQRSGARRPVRQGAAGARPRVTSRRRAQRRI